MRVVNTIRPATPQDAAALHQLVSAHVQEGHLLPRDLDDLSRHADRFVVAERGGDEQSAPTEGVPRKRTRRGSRGGKNRRKRAAANGDGAAAAQPGESGATAPEPEGGRAPETPVDEPVSVPAATPSEPGNGDGYVPMSEWIEDFDRRP